jgi:hypothetical protein
MPSGVLAQNCSSSGWPTTRELPFVFRIPRRICAGAGLLRCPLGCSSPRCSGPEPDFPAALATRFGRAPQAALTIVRDQLDTDPADKFLPQIPITNMRECLARFSLYCEWNVNTGTYDTRRFREPSASDSSRPLPYSLLPQ